MAHITGGGLVENVPRMLPDHVQARLERARWTPPPIFDWLQKQGNVADAEMHRVFNCGIGMVVVVAREDAGRAVADLGAAGELAQPIGTIVVRPSGAAATVIV
jgi:phosphoribosylformylglycinamidine cyclo-ligase